MTWRRFTTLLFGLTFESRMWTALRSRKAPPPPISKGDTQPQA
ncbi:hypothetical protein [Lentzea xinjiangensis]|nr:hypothetical protein [Lentzea xinjiangensis]